MTVERAIELLQHAQTFIDGCSYGLIKIALGMAIDALKMQIKHNESCGWCNKYDEVLCDDWGNCFKYCPVCGRNLGNGV